MIYACRPTDLDPNSELDKIMAGATVYTGEVAGQCARCARSVQIAPRGQELIERYGAELTVCCFVCAALEAGPGAAVQSLDNPEGERW